MTAPPRQLPGQDERQGSGDVRAAISNAMVKLLREHTGRGPRQARTIFQDDVVLVLLDGVLTVAEGNLVTRGQSGPVIELRHAMQLTMEEQFVEIVQRLTGREVVAFMSTNHTEPDMAAELFMLAPLA